MHGCSVPFYFTLGNKEVADKFGIFIGTSHCEPMMRNTNGEWKRDGVGEDDYVHNSAHVLSFWEPVSYTHLKLRLSNGFPKYRKDIFIVLRNMLIIMEIVLMMMRLPTIVECSFCVCIY